MSKSRIKVSFDNREFFWIVADNYSKIIKNPTKEELYGTKLKFYNDKNVCPICLKEKEDYGIELTDKSILYPGNVLHDTDENGDKTEEYICKRHGLRDYNRYDPNSWNNLLKSMTDRRTDNLKDSRNILADNCEDLTSRFFGAKRLSIEYNKYSQLPLDHLPIPNGISIKIGDTLVDLSGKVPQTKGATYNSKNRMWSQNWANEYGKAFDYLIFYCVSKNGKVIERIYIFPKEEVEKRTGIGIFKNPTDSHGNTMIPWYEQYTVIDENVLRNVNEIWIQILND